MSYCKDRTTSTVTSLRVTRDVEKGDGVGRVSYLTVRRATVTGLFMLRCGGIRRGIWSKSDNKKENDVSGDDQGPKTTEGWRLGVYTKTSL